MTRQITETAETGAFHLVGTGSTPRLWQSIGARRQQKISRDIFAGYVVPGQLLKSEAPVHLTVQTCGSLSPREQEITTNTATALLKKIHAEIYSAVEVTVGNSLNLQVV